MFGDPWLIYRGGTFKSWSDFVSWAGRWELSTMGFAIGWSEEFLVTFSPLGSGQVHQRSLFPFCHLKGKNLAASQGISNKLVLFSSLYACWVQRSPPLPTSGNLQFFARIGEIHLSGSTERVWGVNYFISKPLLVSTFLKVLVLPLANKPLGWVVVCGISWDNPHRIFSFHICVVKLPFVQKLQLPKFAVSVRILDP